MGWLKDHEKRLAEETAKRKAHEAELAARTNARHRESISRMTHFYDTKLRDVEGKRTKNGGVMHVKIDGSTADIFIDDECIATVRFYYEEDVEYYNDGGCGPLGTYTATSSMWLRRDWEDHNGTQHSRTQFNRQLYEPELAEYLLSFLKSKK